MRYMITFTHIDGEWGRLGDDGRAALGAWHKEFSAALRAEQGTEMVFFGPPADIRTVRLLADGEFRVDTGPYLQGIERAGGYYIVDVPSLDDAVEWARRGRFMPGSCEVREIATGRM